MTSINDKRERFKKLAEYRTNEIIKRLRVLSNCANRSAYDYTEEDIKKIFNAVEQKLREAKSKFHYPQTHKFNKFKL